MMKIFRVKNLLRQAKPARHSLLSSQAFHFSKQNGDDSAGPDYSQKINSNFPKMEDLLERAEKDGQKSTNMENVNLYEELRETQYDSGE